MGSHFGRIRTINKGDMAIRLNRVFGASVSSVGHDSSHTEKYGASWAFGKLLYTLTMKQHCVGELNADH